LPNAPGDRLGDIVGDIVDDIDGDIVGDLSVDLAGEISILTILAILTIGDLRDFDWEIGDFDGELDNLVDSLLVSLSI